MPSGVPRVGFRAAVTRPLHALLTPASLAVGATALLRRRCFATGLLRSENIGLPVISVGALGLGGSGKTPVTVYLAELIRRRWGLRVGVVHSGYKGRAGSRVLRVDAVEDGAGGWFGDEPALLARYLVDAIVVRGPDKVLAARRCVAEGAQVVLVDDGFQHLRLRRDLDILLNVGQDGWPFPRGYAREFVRASRHAQLRWWHDRTGQLRALDDGCTRRTVAPADADRCARGEWLAAHHDGVVSRYDPTVLVDVDGQPAARVRDLVGRRVFVVAGIARAAALGTTLSALGARVVGQHLVGDHGELSGRRILRAVRASLSDPELIVCSEKDALRSPAALRRVRALALRGRVRLISGRERVIRLLSGVWSCRGVSIGS